MCRRSKSRAHRDRVNAKVMKDPRLAASMGDKPIPFDVKRMVYGGFQVLVALDAVHCRLSTSPNDRTMEGSSARLEKTMRFVCLGYYDEKHWGTLSEPEQNDLMDQCFA